MRTKASQTWVLLSRRRLLNHTSPTVGLLWHGHIFSHRMNWTILLAIWSCLRAKQSYCDQDLNSSQEKCLNFFISQSSSAVGAFLQKGRWPDECPRNQIWSARVATIYRLFETESQDGQIKHQLDATLCRFYFCRVTLHVSGVRCPSSGVLKLARRSLVQVL